MNFRRLWLEFTPSVRTLRLTDDCGHVSNVSNLTSGAQVTSICCDETMIFAGYANGVCKLFR